ncbi:2-oxoglutarate (2OG) and Fe(II)-dependent oxygenase superfamily protein [Euphorbia peplus]|nr:2-oxoglutarate (2OG) and Fe(II)-dependent oxygenase superfamily protein [Euphorbia peplus]
MEKLFKEIEIPNQKHFDSGLLPCILVPNPSLLLPLSLPLLIDSFKSEKPRLESLLHKAGAILFRGFPITTASEFNDVVIAFGYEDLPYVGGAALRSKVIGRVSTANEAPPDQKLHFHHEMSQLPEFPSKVFFYCEVEPASGGETPLVLSHIVYERIKEKYPDFMEKLEEHGLIYIRVLGEDDDPSSPIGRGWKSTFLTDDRSVAEERAAKMGTKLEWLEDGRVRMITGPMPAIKYDESRSRKIWFNNLAGAYTRSDDNSNYNYLMKVVTFGNGEALPDEIICYCQRILEDESISIPWQTGDVLLIDNLAILHTRNSFIPPRRVLASLCK